MVNFRGVLGFGVRGLGFGVLGLGFWGLGFRVLGLWLGVSITVLFLGRQWPCYCVRCHYILGLILPL